MGTIIAVAPNGGRKTRADHPHLPLSAADSARAAAEGRDAGAAMVHLHVRDAKGGHSLDVDLYRDAIAAVRREAGVDMVIQVTSESVGIYDAATQIAMVKNLRPEAVSLALREVAPAEDDKPQFADLLAFTSANRIAAQIILYDEKDALRARRWAEEGIFDAANTSALFVLGRYVPATNANPEDLLPLHRACADLFRDWMVCAFGPRETGCATLAGLLGGHARVGLENNIHLPSGEVAPSNAAIVAATAHALHAVGLAPGTPAELRSLWGI